MKKTILTILILCMSLFLKAEVVKEEGYKGTLPDLSIQQEHMIEQEVPQTIDILPLDKLTLPVKKPVKTDKVLDNYISDMTNVQNQLDRLTEILKGDKSFNNYIASANVLNLTTQNILHQYKEERFKNSNKVLSDINDDVQTIKNYWIKVNKNAPYVSVYATDGVYTGATLNNQLNKFIKVLEYANHDLKQKMPSPEI